MNKNLNFLNLLSIIPVLAIFFRLLPYPFNLLSYLILAFYSFFGASEAIKALLIACFFSVVNVHIFPGASYGVENGGPSSAGQYLVFFSVLTSFFYMALTNKEKFLNLSMLLTILLAVFIVIHSILYSQLFVLSLLKIILWASLMIALIFFWSRLTPHDHQILIKQIFTWTGLSLIFSFPFLFLSEGFVRNEHNFQGLFNSPQVSGIVASLLVAFIFSYFISKNNILNKYLMGLIVFFPILFFSGSRTAIIGLFFGILTSIFLALILIKKPFLDRLLLFKNKYIYVSIIVLILFAIHFSFFESVIQKRGVSTNLISAYIESRSILVDPMLENIRERGWRGIGFGVASDYSSMPITKDPIFGLPYRAAIEKGVLFLAIAEELGFAGLCILLFWLFYIARVAFIAGMHHSLVFFTIVFINLGENILFSPGGIGLLCMILLAWIMTSKKLENTHND